MARGLFGVTDTQDTYLDLVDRAGRDREPFWSGATVFSGVAQGAARRPRAASSRSRCPAAMAGSGLLPEAFGQADSYEIVRSFFDRIDKAAPGTDVLNRMIYSEFKLRLPELLLMRVDKIGMSVSIEPRVPFLDHLLVEFTMNLPMELKVEGGVAKSLFKEAVRGVLPDDVIDRPKMGFGAPMVQWLRGPLRRGDARRAPVEPLLRALPGEPPGGRRHARPPPRRAAPTSRSTCGRSTTRSPGSTTGSTSRARCGWPESPLMSGNAAIEYHAGLARDWEEKYSARRSFRARHTILTALLEGIVEPGACWLDAGCGTGHFSRQLRDARRARDRESTARRA